MNWTCYRKVLKFHTGNANNACHHFCLKTEISLCNDVEGLLQELGCTHNPEECRLFVGSSIFIIKAVLLHNGNIHPSTPNVLSVHMKETKENMDLHLKALSYSKYGWKIRGDLEVTGFSQAAGVQSGYTKFCCFLCE